MIIGNEIILMKERKIIKIFLANLIFVEFLDLQLLLNKMIDKIKLSINKINMNMLFKIFDKK